MNRSIGNLALAFAFAVVGLACSGTPGGGAGGTGGAKSTGGTAGSGGITTGGSSGSGGGSGSGGTGASGGNTGSGGTSSSGGTTSSGGSLATGGVTGGGGSSRTGGSTGTGGSTSTGGFAVTGGAGGSGGATATGGVTGASGATATGGVTGTSGATATGGTTGTGGSTVPTGLYKWASVALGGGGFVSAVIASTTEKNVFYARTDVGGLYRWNEAGQNWIPLTDFASDSQTGFLGVESVALDPQAPGKVYALVGINYFNGGKTAILRSSDHGDTFAVTEVTTQFKAHGNGAGRQNGERLAVDPNLGNILFCGTRANGLFKSTDSGVTWTSVASFPVTTTSNANGVSLVLFDKASGTAGTATPRIFAGVSRTGSDNFYVSTDAGATWNPVAGAPATTQMPQRAALASNRMLFATFGNEAGPGGSTFTTGAIWKYDTVGSTWTNVTPTGITFPFSGISVDAADPNHLVATTINTYKQQPWGWGDHIYVSANAGTSWTDIVSATTPTMDTNGMPWIENHAIHWAGTATFDPNNSDRVFVTSGNGVFSTSNLSAATSTWKFMAKGLEETVPLEAVSIPGYGFANVVGDYDGFVTKDVTVSPPGGTYKPSIGSTDGLALAGAAPGILVRVGSAMYGTTDDGGTWTQAPTTAGIAGTVTGGTVALSADGAVIVWTPNGASTTYRSANNGTQWTTVTGINTNVSPVGDSVNSNKFYAYNASGGAFYASTDGGSSFAQVSTPGAGGSKKPRAVPGIEGDIWIPLYAGGLTRSTNSGTTFTKIAGVSRADAVGFGKAASGVTFPAVYIWGVAAGGPVGIYRSIDVGVTWVRVNDDLHQFGGPANGQFILGDMNIYGRVYMSTAGRGTIYGDPS